MGWRVDFGGGDGVGVIEGRVVGYIWFGGWLGLFFCRGGSSRLFGSCWCRGGGLFWGVIFNRCCNRGWGRIW